MSCPGQTKRIHKVCVSHGLCCSTGIIDYCFVFDFVLFSFQDPSAAVASSTSAGCTPDHLADLIGFVMRCHLEVEELTDTVRRQLLTGQVCVCVCVTRPSCLAQREPFPQASPWINQSRPNQIKSIPGKCDRSHRIAAATGLTDMPRPSSFSRDHLNVSVSSFHARELAFTPPQHPTFRAHAAPRCGVACDVTTSIRVSQDERFGAAPARRFSLEGSAQSQLALTRQVGATVMDLLVQLCGGDGGAVVVGMMSQAFPAGD